MTKPIGDLYERHADLVFKTALRVTGSASDAEDVLQSVFLRLVDRPDNIDQARSPEAYLRRAATNGAIDLVRRRATRAETPVDERAPGPASTALLKERLRRAIAQLEPRDAELFVLRYIEGLSNGELAEQFEMEKVTVATRLHRIRETLKETV